MHDSAVVIPVDLDRFDGRVWRFSMGLDLAYSPDKDAIAVIGWRKDDGAHKLWLVYEFEQGHQDVDQLSAVFVPLVRRFKPLVIIADDGGHGAVKTLKTIENRLGGFEITPKPRDLEVSTGLINDELRTGRLRVFREGHAANDFPHWQWQVKNGKKERSPVFHSDITEAVRYAVWGATHWMGKDPPPEASAEDKRRAELVALNTRAPARYHRSKKR